MFICDKCNRNSATKEKPIRIITETRVVKYDLGDGRTSTGSEIVKEQQICNECNLILK